MAELVLHKQNIDLLNERISIKDSIIKSYKMQSTAYDDLVSNTQKEIAIYKEQLTIETANVKALTKRVRWLKFKATVAEVVSGGVIVYLLLK